MNKKVLDEVREIRARVGRNIAYLREKKLGFSQRELGRILGLGQGHVSEFESGARLSLNYIVFFSKFYDVSLSSLIGCDFREDEKNAINLGYNSHSKIISIDRLI